MNKKTLPGRRSPNVLIVVLDAVRASNLSCYGHLRKTTPCIDDFTAGSTLFENAYTTAPWTLPSHASMLTGLYPSEHKAHAKHTYLNKDIPYLPEILRDAGYDTSLFTYVPFLTDQFGMERGFTNVYQPYQILSGLVEVREWLEERKWARGLTSLGDRFWRRIAARMGDSGARPITRNAIRWISKHPRDTNWFMMINYFDAHLPYWPPSEFRRAFLPASISTARLKDVNQNPWAYYSGRVSMTSEDFQLLERLYDAAILYLDHWLGHLMGFLRESGRIADTMVIITSDHGENLTEKPVFGHNLYLNEQLLRVPLIIRYPKRFSAGQRVSKRVQLLDLFYAILEVVGLDDLQRAAHATRTSSLSRTIAGDDAEGLVFAQYYGMRETPDDQRHKLRYPEVDFEQFDRAAYAIIQGDYKLIFTPDVGEELYNLSLDPEETQDLCASQPEIVEELRELLHKSFPKGLAGSQGEGKYGIDPEVERRLADLGYI